MTATTATGNYADRRRIRITKAMGERKPGEIFNVKPIAVKLNLKPRTVGKVISGMSDLCGVVRKGYGNWLWV